MIESTPHDKPSHRSCKNCFKPIKIWATGINEYRWVSAGPNKTHVALCPTEKKGGGFGYHVPTPYNVPVKDE